MDTDACSDWLYVLGDASNANHRTFANDLHKMFCSLLKKNRYTEGIFVIREMSKLIEI